MPNKGDTRIQRTVNPAAFCYVERHPSAYTEAYHAWIYAQLSRMPYLCKSLVREAICRLLVPDLSRSLDLVATDRYLAGWQKGYQDGLRKAKECADA